MARRKPLTAQAGNLKRDKIVTLKQEEASVKTASGDLTVAPEWLNDIGKAEWYRVLPQLRDIDIIGNLDLSDLAGYCNAYSHFVIESAALANEDLILIDETTGSRKENPRVNTQIKYATEMRKFADTCGMTISSRLKAAATKTAKKEEEIKDAFGAI